jgi:hypothetical protein
MNFNRRKKKKNSLLVISLNRQHKRKMAFEAYFRTPIESIIRDCNYGLNHLILSEEQQQ